MLEEKIDWRKIILNQIIKKVTLSFLALFCTVACSTQEPVRINYDLEGDVIGYFYYDKVLYRIDKVIKKIIVL